MTTGEVLWNLIMGGVAYFIGYLMGWRARGKEDEL